MSSATSAAWASVGVAMIASAANIWSAYDSHVAKQESLIAKATLDAAQAKVIALQYKADTQDTVLSNAMERVKLYGDMLAAGGGNRFAYKRATEALQTRILAGDKGAKSLDQQLCFQTRHFMGKIEHNSTLQYYMMGPLSEDLKAHVTDMLRRDDVQQRVCAIKHIHGFRLNKHIPLVVDCLEREPDLNVIQLAVYVVNETFRDNMVFNDTNTVYSLSAYDCALRYGEFKKYFDRMWEPRKDRILANQDNPLKPNEIKRK